MESGVEKSHLESISFFSELEREEKLFICENAVIRSLKKGETVYFQKDAAKRVYFLKTGKIKISKFTPSGEEFVVGFFGKGEIFGESSITDNKWRQEAAIVEEDAVFLAMKEEKFRKLLLKVPTLHLKFCQFLENRLEKARKRLQDISCKNNQQRILEFLKEAALVSSEDANGEILINNSLTHQKIAQLTSTNRQQVSSVLSSLKKNRIIDYNRKTIRILKMNDLHA